MGGFRNEYQAGTVTEVYSGSTGDRTTDAVAMRIDEDRQLWVWSSQFSGQCHACVTTCTAPPAFTVGAVVLVRTGMFGILRAAQLDPSTWLVHNGDHWARVSVSGDTVTIVDTGTFPFSALTWPDGYNNDPWSPSFDRANVVGVDADHLLFGASFQRNAEPFDIYYGWAVWRIEDNTATAVAQFGIDVDYVPYRNDDPVYRDLPVTTGESYWRVSDDAPDFLTITACARITAAPDSITLELVTGIPDAATDSAVSGPMHRSADGRYWLIGDLTDDVWSVAHPMEGTRNVYAITGATAALTAYSYEDAVPSPSVDYRPAGPDLMAALGWTFHVDDTHWRDDAGPAVTTYPAGVGASTVLEVGGVEEDSGYLLAMHADTAGPPYSVKIFILRETPQVPTVDFFFDPIDGTAPLGVDFDGTLAIDATRDSYWHPITSWHWYFDDGADTVEADPLTAHDYTAPSIGHVSGDDLPVEYDGSGSPGDIDYYLPALSVSNSVGASLVRAIVRLVHVLPAPGRPPLAHRQRRDGAATVGPPLAHLQGAVGSTRPDLAHRQQTP